MDTLNSKLLIVTCEESFVKHDYVTLYVSLGERLSIQIPNDSINLNVKDVCMLKPKLKHKLFCCEKTVVACIMLDRSIVYSTLMPMITSCNMLFEFLVQCQHTDECLDYLHFAFESGEDVVGLINFICKENMQKKTSYEAAIKAALTNTFVILLRNYTVKSSSKNLPPNSQLALIIGYLCENYRNATLKGTAEYFNYHPNSISSMIKKNLGKSFSEILRDIRLENACTLLKETNLTICDIASLCGYEHMTNFYKTFKSEYGITPKAFSKRSKTHMSSVQNNNKLKRAL